MASYSRVKPPQGPHDNNDDRSSLYSRPSIQNSPDWPSVKLHSPGSSVRTLNQSDGGTYRDDISSLANFSSKDTDPSDCSSVFTANMLASPSSSRPSTPSGSFRGKYQPLPVLLEKSGERRRNGGSTKSSRSIRADKRPHQPGSPPLVLSSRETTIGSTTFQDDSSYRSVWLLIDYVNEDLPRQSVLTTPSGDVESRSKHSSEGRQPVSTNDTAMLCHSCGLLIEGAFVGTLGTTIKYHLQCFKSIGGHEDHKSILQVTEVPKSLPKETKPGAASAEQKVGLWRYNANLVSKLGEAVQNRLNIKMQPGLGSKRQLSGDLFDVQPGLLWIHTVPKEIVDSVSDQERQRQEAINEVIYTERDFVRDMEYLRDVWIAPLSASDIIPEHRRAYFIQQVFCNIHDVIVVNTRLRDALNKRQKSYAVIEGIADIFRDNVPDFAPFVSYGVHQLYGKYEFEKEKRSNPAFAQFVEETERRPDSRKLELQAYLTKPTTRLARYPLLLEAVLKQTSEESSDKQEIPKVVTLIHELLAEVNLQTSRTENRFNLLQLEQQLLFYPGEQVGLRLQEEGREMIYKGPLKCRGGSQSNSGELLVFLLDHALLMVKQKNKADQFKVYQHPIPLELLHVIAADETGMRSIVSRPLRNSSNSNGDRNAQPYPPILPVKFKGSGGNTGLSITFVHLGRKFYQMTLWAATQANHRKWIENITRQQDLMRERSQFFKMNVLSEGFFRSVNRVNCAAPFSGGQKVVYGTFDGVYFQDLREPNREPAKVLALTDVVQVDILDSYGLLIVLSEGQVVTFPLDTLEAMDPLAGLKRAKRIAADTSFFKSGICFGRTFVCVVKTSPFLSTIKIFKPIDQNVRGRNKPTLLQGGNDTLRIYKEFSVRGPSNSIHFLRTKLCVACVNGFELIDPDTLDTEGLPDPSDESLDFVRRRGDNTLPKPVAISQIKSEFLLCYDEFAFYINRSGRRSRKNFLVHWEGAPTSFAFQYPYVLAFEPTFVEIRNVETGSMSQVIQGNNLRCLFTGPGPDAAYGQQYPGQLPTPLVYPGQLQQTPPYGRGVGAREEIILVSDDRVLTLRMMLPDQ